MRGHVRKRTSARGRTSYQVIVKITDPATGQARQLSGTRKTRAEADTLLVKLLSEAGRSSAVASTATVATLLEAWQEVNAEEWSPTTVTQTRMIVGTYLVPRLGKVRLSKLRTSDIDALYAELRKTGRRDGKALSRATVQRIHTVMRSALTQAVRWEWVADNPAARAKVPKGGAHKITPPAPAQVIRLLEAAAGDDGTDDFGVWLRVAAATGARRGEVCALRWTDLDLNAKKCRIERAIAGDAELVERQTKTGNSRQINLDDETVEILRAHRARCRRRALAAGHRLADDVYLFSLEVEADQPWRPSLATKRFVRLRDELGLTVRLHDLRHFVATTMLANGIDLATVGGHLGHAGGGKTTLAVYAHFLETADQRAADLIGDTLNSGTA